MTVQFREIITIEGEKYGMAYYSEYEKYMLIDINKNKKNS